MSFGPPANRSHCHWKHTNEHCAAWRKLRKAVAVLMKEARPYAKGVDELRDATGGRPANIYQFACGSVVYFAPEAPDFIGKSSIYIPQIQQPDNSCVI